MIRNWYNQIPHPVLKTKREITKYIKWRQFTKRTRKGLRNLGICLQDRVWGCSLEPIYSHKKAQTWNGTYTSKYGTYTSDQIRDKPLSQHRQCNWHAAGTRLGILRVQKGQDYWFYFRQWLGGYTSTSLSHTSQYKDQSQSHKKSFDSIQRNLMPSNIDSFHGPCPFGLLYQPLWLRPMTW